MRYVIKNIVTSIVMTYYAGSSIMLAKNKIEISFQNHVDIKEIVSAWRCFLASKNNWQELISGCPAIPSKCGLVYELPNFLNQADEGFAIVDMRELSFAEPHYHPDNDIEVYFVLQGTALVVVGKHELRVATGDVIVIPPNKAHFTIPDNNFVIAVVNTPPYTPEHHIVLTESNSLVDFNQDQFERLTHGM